MSLEMSTLWWVLAGLAVAAELATGTFYLLMVALGLAAGAVAAHLGMAIAWQVALAALIGSGTTALWHWRRSGQSQTAPVAENRDVNLDVGERVSVAEWQPDLTTRVPYRGSVWQARLKPGAHVHTGEHLVTAVEGNWLVLAPLHHHH